MSALRVLRASALPLGGALSLARPRQDQNQGGSALSMGKMKVTTKSLHSFAANSPTEDRSLYYEDRDRDTRIFGVFDGHGGWNVSNFLHHNMTSVLLRHMEGVQTSEEHSSSTSADALEVSLLRAFTELEETYVEKIRPAYELGFGGT